MPLTTTKIPILLKYQSKWHPKQVRSMKRNICPKTLRKVTQTASNAHHATLHTVWLIVKRQAQMTTSPRKQTATQIPKTNLDGVNTFCHALEHSRYTDAMAFHTRQW